MTSSFHQVHLQDLQVPPAISPAVEDTTPPSSEPTLLINAACRNDVPASDIRCVLSTAMSRHIGPIPPASSAPASSSASPEDINLNGRTYCRVNAAICGLCT